MPVTITLENDEALVLFEALSSQRFSPADVAERNALWALEALLQKQLVGPFEANYASVIQAARLSLIARLSG